MSRRGALVAASRFVAQPGGGDGGGGLPTTALLLDGATAYLMSAEPFDMNADYTVFIYARLADAGHKAVIWMAGDEAGANYDALLVRTGTPNMLEWQTVVAESEVVSTGFSGPGFDTWAQIAVRRDGNELAIFSGGTRIYDLPLGDITGRGAASKLVIGAYRDGSVVDSFLSGAALGFIGYQSALTDGEIAAQAGHLRPVKAGHWGAYLLSGPSDLAEMNEARAAFVGAGTLSTTDQLPAGLAL